MAQDMIAKDYLIFVKGANVDDDHPFGDIDRIDYELGRYRERDNPAVLAGVDIVYLLECYLLRFKSCKYYVNFGWAYDDPKFHRNLDLNAIKFLVSVFNNLWSDWWVCPNSNWEDCYNWEKHGTDSGESFQQAFAGRFWSGNSHFTVELATSANGNSYKLMTEAQLNRLYQGLHYYKVFRCPFWGAPTSWSISAPIELINGGMYDSGGAVEPTTPYTVDQFSLVEATAKWYPDEQRWRGYIARGYMADGFAWTIDLKEQFPEAVLKCIGKVKLAYKVYSFAYYSGDFGDGAGDGYSSDSKVSWVTGSTWYEPSADGTLTVYPMRDARLMQNSGCANMDHNEWPIGAPTDASSSTICDVHKQYSLYSGGDNLTMLVRLKDEYCYSGATTS